MVLDLTTFLPDVKIQVGGQDQHILFTSDILFEEAKQKQISQHFMSRWVREIF